MNTQTKTVLKTALFTIAIGGMISVFSCRKDSPAASESSKSPTPATHDKPYSLRSNANREIGIMIEDINGNLIPFNKTRKKGDAALSTCNDDSWATKLVYRGYTISSVCFNEPAVGSYMSVSWDLYLPENVNITNDASCVARVKVGNAGFYSSPTGTGFRTLNLNYQYIETVDIDGSGTMMKKWRITSSATPFSETDYCENYTLTPTFKIKTDCIDLATIQPALTTDAMEINSLTVPDFWPQNGNDPNNPKINMVVNIPLCGNGCHGYWKWATNIEVQCKLTSSATWSATTTHYSSNVESIFVRVHSGPGTYEVRYRGLMKGTVTDGVWSEWTTPLINPTVTIP